MDMTKADMWLASHSKYFKPEQMGIIQEKIMNLPEDRVNMLYAVQLRDPTNMLLVSIFAGEFGVDRFMLKQTGLGVGKLLTLGGCLVWWLIDIFLIGGATKDYNYNQLMQVIGYHG